VNRHAWRPLLEQWSQEILASDADYWQSLPEEVIASGWLGYPGATEEQIAVAEQRLGTRLPPSYREFLAVTNGWRHTTPFIDRLWSTEEIEWFPVRHQGWIDAWRQGAEAYEQTQSAGRTRSVEEDPLLQELASALDISDVGDVAIYVLNPKATTLEGEWEAWFFSNWNPGAARHRSFWDLLLAEHETFLRLRQS
jgi:cell wall assembly regulator SMI1